MLEKIAQSLAETASQIIGYHILITGEDGIVLGAADTSRLGTLHEASFEVIRTGRQVFHDEDAASKLQGTRAGTTLPIILKDSVVGSIGISGTPSEISRYGLLIKTLAEVFLRDRIELESARLRDQSRQNLLREIITYDEHSNDAGIILSHGEMLGYDLQLPRVVLMIAISSRDEPREDAADTAFNINHLSLINNFFIHQQDFCVSLGQDRYAVFMHGYLLATEADFAERARLRSAQLIERLQEQGLRAWVGIGSLAHDLVSMKKSYHDSNQALAIVQKQGQEGYLYINDIHLEKLIYNIPEQAYMRFYQENLLAFEPYMDSLDMVELVFNWCECKFNLTDTASKLSIHKNTLKYRINRFKEVTGLDLQDAKTALTVYLTLMLIQLHKA